jgi:ubiquinone/menaquinone biosynthesis C-methylase UbiE
MIDRERRRKEGLARLFDQVASTFDHVGPRFFSHFGRRLVEVTQIPTGAVVLDVATGRGAILFPAAEQVGPQGHAVGIDLSAGMVRETVAEIKSCGLKNIAMYQMDAEYLTFPGASFDVVLCGLSLFFFPQLQRALGEFYRVLKPGGRVGVTTFAEDSEYENWLSRVFRPYRPSPDSQTNEEQTEPSLLTLDTPERLETVLSNAGFVEIQITKEEAGFVYKNEEELWASLWSHGARRSMERMESSTLERFKADIFQSLQAFKRTDGIHMPPKRVLFALGIKPHC